MFDDPVRFQIFISVVLIGEFYDVLFSQLLQMFTENSAVFGTFFLEAPLYLDLRGQVFFHGEFTCVLDQLIFLGEVFSQFQARFSFIDHEDDDLSLNIHLGVVLSIRRLLGTQELLKIIDMILEAFDLAQTHIKSKSLNLDDDMRLIDFLDDLADHQDYLQLDVLSLTVVLIEVAHILSDL